MKFRLVVLFILLIGVSVVGERGLVYADHNDDDDDEEELEESERELRKELEAIEEEIAEQTEILKEKQEESVSIERDLAIIEAEITRSELSIRQRDLEIHRLSGEIANREVTIVDLTEKLARERASLAQLIRRTNEIDDTSLVEVVLSNKDISEFFEDLDAFDTIQTALRASSKEAEATRIAAGEEKVLLEGSRVEENQLRGIQVLEQEQIEIQEAQKEDLLALSRSEEAKYEAVIAEKQKSAAEIRARLFRLRGAGPIPFGEAVQLATLAEDKTGVRAALILGVLQQETKLGENVGQCNLPDDPPEYKWQNIMKPDRDHEPYLAIMERLGFDPEDMPLSCAPGYGYGGAMGPAQFIPSTWVLYEDKVADLTGNNPPNPWNPEDAFMASALLLKDNGASRGGWDNERLAALRYFAGWGNAEKPSYAFYGDSVMRFAGEFQKDIDFLADS